MEQYGSFSPVVAALEDRLKEARMSWRDEIAATFDTINENLEQLAALIWAHKCNAEKGYNAVRENYNEDLIDDELYALSARIDAV